MKAARLICGQGGVLWPCPSRIPCQREEDRGSVGTSGFGSPSCSVLAWGGLGQPLTFLSSPGDGDVDSNVHCTSCPEQQRRACGKGNALWTLECSRSLLLASLSLAQRTVNDTLIAFSPISRSDRNRNVKHLFQCSLPRKLFLIGKFTVLFPPLKQNDNTDERLHLCVGLTLHGGSSPLTVS